MTYNFNRRDKMKTDIYTKVVLTVIADQYRRKQMNSGYRVRN